MEMLLKLFHPPSSRPFLFLEDLDSYDYEHTLYSMDKKEKLTVLFPITMIINIKHTSVA